MTIYDLLNMLGGLSLFLFGMHILSGALEKLAGGKLEKILKKMTDRPIKALLLGVAITATIQSSSAVTVMLVGLVNSGIMQLGQAIGVIMGSNIGTTVTAWLLSLAGIIWSVVAYFLSSTVAGWSSIIAIICFFGGIQILCIGVIGEYIGKIYMETKARPRYIISKKTDEEEF